MGCEPQNPKSTSIQNSKSKIQNEGSCSTCGTSIRTFQILNTFYNLQTLKNPISMFHTGTKSRTKSGTKWSKMPPKDKYAIVER
jgi:hypothetical protein